MYVERAYVEDLSEQEKTAIPYPRRQALRGIPI